MFKNPFSFKGRIRRLEYNLSILIYVVFIIVSTVITVRFYTYELSIILLVIRLPLIWFMLAQGAKRCHDVGNSGWYIIIPLYSLVLMFLEGDMGENQRGPDPKGFQSAGANPGVLDDLTQ